MKIYVAVSGNFDEGFDSSCRGESKWANSLARCFADGGHQVVIGMDNDIGAGGFPAYQRAQWPNITFYQGDQVFNKKVLKDEVFDIAIFTNWQDEKEVKQPINAKKYVYGIMSWKDWLMVDGYFDDNEYVCLWSQGSAGHIPEDINFKDRCFILPQPFGPQYGDSKFKNKRVAWVAKDVFYDVREPATKESGKRNFIAALEACRENDCEFYIFSGQDFDATKHTLISEYGIDSLIKSYDKAILIPNLSAKDYREKLQSCSVTIPINQAGSVPESIFYGLVPVLYKDGMWARHPGIKEIVSELTHDAWAHRLDKKNLGIGEIRGIINRLLSDEDFFNTYLERLRVLVEESLDTNVLKQLEKIVNHEVTQ